jgi:aminopeptidase N
MVYTGCYMSKSVARLFTQFKPDNYHLLLDIDKPAMTFNGSVTIAGIKVGRPSKRLTFHQKDLKIKQASVIKLDKTGEIPIKISRINNQNSSNEVRLHSDELIYPGRYKITMEFSGIITKPMHGIYPCFFKHEGKDKNLITTQFESHHAREAFPCIDEPEAKATFDLTILSPLNEVVIANTPMLSESKKSDKRLTTFETSPIMSTYLLAFAIGEIHSVSGETKDGVKVSSWATVAQPKDHLNYANNEAIEILEFFNDYYRTPFPLKKLDQIALPDFESLAMENWGLITFREVGLLADPDNRSLSGEQLITLVIAHEISHQWFGDLVTMKWWDDLWLNESFASIMENVAPDRLHPDWQQWEDFVTGRVLSCSHRDIYKDVQPVGVEVKQPDEILTLFDPAIVYAKGARLINMLLEYIGEDSFRNGLETYFKKFAYSNTSRHDLWKTLGSISNQDIDKFMTPWISQSGQPLLRVTRDGNKIKLSQKRFLMDGEDNETLWPIPLLSDQDLDLSILDKRTAEITYDESKASPIFNVNGNGHYIVSYQDKTSKDNLRSKLIDRSLGTISRITVLNDMLLLARAGEYELPFILDIIYNSNEEPRDAVWALFSRIIGQAQSLSDGNEEVDKDIKVFKRKLAEYWYKKLGWEDKASDDPNTKHLRTTALALSISGENPDAIVVALKKYEEAGSVEKLPAEQRALIAGANVRNGKAEVIDQLMDEYTSSQNPEVRQTITVALCSTRDESVAKRIIDWGMSEKGVVRPQDIDHWYAYLMRNYHTRDLAWEWFLSSWDFLKEQAGGGKSMEYLVWYSSGPISTPEWQTKFVNFFKPKLDDVQLKRNIQIAFSEIETRVAWRKREEAALAKYFSIKAKAKD